MAAADTMIRAVAGSSDPTNGVIELDAVENPTVRAGVAYWRQIRGERKFPSREQVQPRGIAGLLRNTLILRASEDGDHEFRIVGDAHVIAHGFSIQGKRISQIEKHAPGYGAMLKSIYDPVIAQHTAFGLRGWLLKGEKQQQFLHTEAVFLPLGPHDDTVDHVLNFSAYVARDSKD